MAKLSDYDRHILQLIGRSAAGLEGWRSVSNEIGYLILHMPRRELIEYDAQGSRVRLTKVGETVLEYLC